MGLRSILMGIAFAVMWSSAFTSARVIVQQAPAITALSLRFLISGCLAIFIAYLLGQRISLNRKQWVSIFIFGLCQNGLYLGLFFVAMQRIEASLAAIIASMMPLLVALFGSVFLHDRLSRLGVAGLLLGFLGVAIIMIARFDGGMDPLGLVFCVIGVVALAVATLAVRGASSGGNIWMVVGLQMLIASAALFVPAVLFETWDVTWSLSLGVAFAYTTLVPGILATVVWFLLVGQIGATKAAAFHFLNPFFGVAIAAVILGESITTRDVVGVVIIMTGILAVQYSRSTGGKG